MIDSTNADFRALLREVIDAGDHRRYEEEDALVDLAWQHPSSAIRRSAMVSLRKLSSQKLWPIIHSVLALSENENLRETAIRSIGDIGDSNTCELLQNIAASESRARFGRQAAVNAQRKLKASSHGEPLAKKTRPEVNTLRDVFICHSGKDKVSVVDPLVCAIKRAGLSCWYDTAEILLGDSITKKVNEGLKLSRYVLAVISESFLQRDWPERELNAVINLECSLGVVKLLLLIVGDEHHKKSVFDRFPLLNDKLYMEWRNDPNEVAERIKERLAADTNGCKIPGMP